MEIEIGSRIKSYDEQQDGWFLTEIIEINGDRVLLKDIDKNSNDQGFEWGDYVSNLDDPKYYRELG